MKNNGKKLLIIEDEISLLQILSDKFMREGFLVFQAKDGMEGLRMAKKHQPDLILLDVVMPTMDGITMIKKLRQEKDSKHLPVMFFSNLSDVERVSTVLGVGDGVIDYLTKSHWSLEDLVKKVRVTLKI